MRVPVRLGAEGPRYYGPRHAPPNVTRIPRYYGGDIRRQDPLSLVFHGHLGARLAQDTEMTLQWPTDAAPAIDPSGYSLAVAPVALDTSWVQQFEVPATVSASDILRGGVPSPTYQAPAPATAAPEQVFSEGGAPTVTVPPPAGAPPPGSTPWWNVLPAVTGAAAAIGATIAKAVTGPPTQQVYNPATGQMVTIPRPPTQQVYNPATGQMITVPSAATPTSYTIPATATQPAQQVTYDPTTGQVSTVPLTGFNAALPSFLQSVPGAPWYQNPLVWVGGGAGLLLLVVLMSSRR
jgi:hypothetical protein